MTYTELAENINKDFTGCFAYTEGKKVVVTYRGKKTDKVFISEGVVTNIGSTTSIAAQISEKYGFQNNVK